MSTEDIINALDSVRSNGTDKWMAKCPAHNDKSPSLSIKALPDGSTLMYCHARCYTEDIMAALGLTMGDLFGDTPFTPKRPRGPSEDEIVVAIYDADKAKGVRHTEADQARYKQALARLNGRSF